MFNTLSYPEIKFPEGFLWGSATAAHQIEGDDVNSREWHQQMNNPRIEKSGKACNSYQLYKEDIELLKSLGHQAYRLSIPWSRIEPSEGEFCQTAIDHYVDLLNRLKEAGIKTFVTLLHGSSPQWFEERGGMLNRENFRFFERYVTRIVKAIHKYVDYWMVINEFNIAGGRLDEDYRVHRANNLIAHARGYHIIKTMSNAPVSSAHALRADLPANPFDKFDRIFAELDDWKVNEFFFHAIRTGEIVLPYMDAEYVPEVKDSLDYWAINYYCRNLVSARKQTADSVWYTATHQKMIDMNFYLEEFYPEGLLNGLQRLKDKPVFITENGLACDDDRWRILKIAQDLAAVSDAIKSGVDVRGYLHWSFMDNFEWYTFKPRFGLVHVDFETFRRTPKPSAYFYKELIERNGFDGELIRKYLPDVPVFKLYQ